MQSVQTMAAVPAFSLMAQDGPPPHMPCAADAQDIQAYLRAYFYTLGELAEAVKESPVRIQSWIDAGCIPQHSYAVTASLSFHTRLFGTTELPAQTELYYASSHIHACKKTQNLLQKMGLDEARVRIRQDFYTEFRSALKQVHHGKTAWSCCFQNFHSAQFNETALAEVLKQQWGYVQDGSYGVCLKEVKALHIVRRQAVLCEIDAITDQERKSPIVLTHEEKKALTQSIEIYQQLSMPFAPHERAMGIHQKISRIMAYYHITLPPPTTTGPQLLKGDRCGTAPEVLYPKEKG